MHPAGRAAGRRVPKGQEAASPGGPAFAAEPTAAAAAAPSALRLERPQLLTELAYQRIREAVVAGELKLGEQVSEAQLAAGMGVSKTPVREALLRLKVEGLVDISPQRGTFVFALGPDQVAQLCRYRAMVEAEALREAAATAPRALVAAMARRVAEMRKAERAKDASALARIDMDFHWQFFAHSPNAYLRAGYEVIRGQLVALRHRSPITNAVASHRVLVQAVDGGDIEHACALLREHVLENEPRYRAACARA
jgi:DNA-binding GntR family transcriptional regulator